MASRVNSADVGNILTRSAAECYGSASCRTRRANSFKQLFPVEASAGKQRVIAKYDSATVSIAIARLGGDW